MSRRSDVSKKTPLMIQLKFEMSEIVQKIEFGLGGNRAKDTTTKHSVCYIQNRSFDKGLESECQATGPPKTWINGFF